MRKIDIIGGIHVLSGFEQFEVEMRACGAAGRADAGDDLPAVNSLILVHINRVQLGV